MITAVLIDQAPVASLGARRWYATARLGDVNTADHTAVVALCEALLGGHDASDGALSTPRRADNSL